MTKTDKRNKVFFGLGTVGRDMFYAFEANALLYFLSNILSLPVAIFAAASLVLSVLRIFDALNDVRNLEQAIKSTKKYGGQVEATLSYTISPIHN